MYLQVAGGARLMGTVAASGSKNATLALMGAAMLLNGETVLRGMPRIADVEVFRTILAQVGVESAWTGAHTLVLSGGRLHEGPPSADLCRKMRASYYVMGPLLGLVGRFRVGLPGGDAIGTRPVDLHFRAFEALGAKVGVEGGQAVAEADRLQGAAMTLVGPHGSSVGATINALLAAVVTPGTTRIYGAAREPEVWEVAAMLNRAGARIAGAGTGTMEVEGVSRLHAVEWTVPGDRIEASTYLLAGAATGGNVCVENVAPWALGPLPDLLEQMGCRVSVDPAAMAVRVEAPRRLKAVEAVAAPFPALASDAQPVLAAALCKAQGDSVISEQVYDGRLGYTRELERMGAQVRVVGTTAVISGVPRLVGAPVAGHDLRATASLVLGALLAEGESQVEGLEHLDRGYEGMEAKLTQLGASIRREGLRESAQVISLR